MTTSVKTVDNSAWSLVLSGAGIIQLKTRGHIHLHIGTTSPTIDTEAFYSLPRANEIDFSYSGTENVYCMNGASGDIVLVCTNIV